MTIITNAGADDLASPAERRVAEAALAEVGIQQDLDHAARAAALRQEKPRREVVSLEAGSEITLDMGGGEQRTFQGAALGFELDEPDIDESVDTLAARNLQFVEDVNWPFKPAGARAGVRPTLGPKAWHELLEIGSYCLRCLGRMRAPQVGESCLVHGDACLVLEHDATVEHGVGGSCFRCALTPTHRANALDFLERVAEVHHVAGPARDVRRAMSRKVKRPGLVLPGQTW